MTKLNEILKKKGIKTLFKWWL